MSSGWPRITPTPARLARGLAAVPGLTVEQPETNLVFFDTRATGLTADELAERLRAGRACCCRPMGQYRVRACTHLDVDADGVDEAVRAVAEALR